MKTEEEGKVPSSKSKVPGATLAEGANEPWCEVSVGEAAGTGHWASSQMPTFTPQNGGDSEHHR